MSNSNTCPQEPLILAAIGTAMSEDLSRHLANCDSCQDAKLLAEQMHQLATQHIAAPPPDPDIIWMIARLSKPPAAWTSDTVAGVATLAASALLAIWIWPEISGYLSGIVPKSATTANVFLTSCFIAAAIAGVAARTLRRLTGE